MPRILITNTEYDAYTGTVTAAYAYEWTARDGSRIRTTVTVCDVGRSCDVAALAQTGHVDLLQPEDVPHRDYRTERLERSQARRWRDNYARAMAKRREKTAKRRAAKND